MRYIYLAQCVWNSKHQFHIYKYSRVFNTQRRWTHILSITEHKCKFVLTFMMMRIRQMKEKIQMYSHETPRTKGASSLDIHLSTYANALYLNVSWIFNWSKGAEELRFRITFDTFVLSFHSRWSGVEEYRLDDGIYESTSSLCPRFSCASNWKTSTCLVRTIRHIWFSA